MGEENYNNFIKEYKRVRKLLKDMYVYGCYRNTDYNQKLGISISAYEKEIKRMRFYMEDENRVRSKASYNSIYGFSYDRFRNEINYFINTYKLKAYTQKYMQRFISIMQILKHDGELSISELSQKMVNCQIEEEERKIRNIMKDLVDYEIVIKLPKRKYKLNECILDKLSVEELMELYYAADFFANKSPLSVPSLFLKDTIRRRLKGKTTIEEESIFVYEYNFLHTIFNDDIIYKLWTAIRENKAVEVSMYRYLFSNEKDGFKKKIYPYRILSEYSYGRQYVIGIEEESQKAVSIRIDRIEEAKVLNDSVNIMQYGAELKKFETAWCVAMNPNGPELVEIDFYTKDRNYIRSQVKQEGKWGIIEDLEEGHFVYRIEVNSAMEMKPWIRKFGADAQVRYSKQHNVREQLIEDWKEALGNYGVISEK